MSLPVLPAEVHYCIIDFIQPEKITSTQIKSCARQIVNISLANKELKEICSKKLADLKKINDLVNKYSKYNSDYENSYIDFITGPAFDPKGNPQLLDALFTGCRLPYADSTFKVYTPEIEQDIKDIVELTPQSMNCILGVLRCRYRVPPLVAACINENIPLHIVEFLLQQGANPNATLEINGRPIPILRDLKSNLDPQRFAAIEALFNKYTAV